MENCRALPRYLLDFLVSKIIFALFLVFSFLIFGWKFDAQPRSILVRKWTLETLTFWYVVKCLCFLAKNVFLKESLKKPVKHHFFLPSHFSPSGRSTNKSENLEIFWISSPEKWTFPTKNSMISPRRKKNFRRWGPLDNWKRWFQKWPKI